MEGSGQKNKATSGVRNEESANDNEQTTPGQNVIRTEGSNTAICSELQKTDEEISLLCARIKHLRSIPTLGNASNSKICSMMRKWQEDMNAALSGHSEPDDSKSFEGSDANDYNRPIFDLEDMGLSVPHRYPKMSSDMMENIKEYYKKIKGVRRKASTGVADDSMIDLNSGKELYSDIVNEKMKLIAARSKNASGRLPSVFVLPYEVFCYLYNFKEEQEALNLALSFCNIDVYDMLSSNLIMFPLHFSKGTNHWALVVVDLRPDHYIVVQYYDSIIERAHNDQIQRAEKSLALVKKYLEVARTRSTFVGKVLDRQWKLDIANGIPQQDLENVVDCGVFILKFADYISFGIDLNFTQSHIPYFRKVIAWELINERMFLMPQQATVAEN